MTGQAELGVIIVIVPVCVCIALMLPSGLLWSQLAWNIRVQDDVAFVGIKK